MPTLERGVAALLGQGGSGQSRDTIFSSALTEMFLSRISGSLSFPTRDLTLAQQTCWGWLSSQVSPYLSPDSLTAGAESLCIRSPRRLCSASCKMRIPAAAADSPRISVTRQEMALISALLESELSS